MRYLKRLLAAIYIFLGGFAVVCLIMWCITGNEPTTLVTAVFAAAGVESVAGVMLKYKESKDAKTDSTDDVTNGRAE